MPTIAPYGSWKSPITPDLVVAGGIALTQIALDGPDIYWIEQRPTEAGRNVIVRCTPDGQTRDINPPPFNVRTRVHEYGGGAMLIADGIAYYSNFADQRLYRQSVNDLGGGAKPQPLTPPVDMRYADATLDRRRNRLIAIRADHTTGAPQAVNTIVALHIAPGLPGVTHPTGETSPSAGQILVSGNDFYATARLSPDGNSLAYLTWNHPNMPWDGCELHLAQLDRGGGGKIISDQKIAGSQTESVFQPEWSPDGILYFIAETTGWWNLYRYIAPGLPGGTPRIEAVCPMSAEFGEPLWGLSQRTYAFQSARRLICTYLKAGSQLASLDTQTLKLENIKTPYTSIGGIQASATSACFIGGSPTQTASIVQLDLSTKQTTILRRSSETTIDPAYISIPQEIEFPTENGLTAFGFYYPPTNKDFVAPSDEKPPLIVRSHGGPTAATGTTLRAAYQYWTSRGFAILDVNYGGSTGYGRAYRQRLNGQWGVVDVDDCCNGARFLAKEGKVDPDRLLIDGGSAGGYTTLCALTFRDVFHAGASYFGIGELEVFTKDTHKYESRYLDHLVGPYPARKDLYFARSPINFVDRMHVPLILFQGLEDKIVPPNQAEMFFQAVRKKGLPVACIYYEGEQHGFRKAPNIKRTLEAELYFYAKIFHFPLADKIDPVKIENLPP